MPQSVEFLILTKNRKSTFSLLLTLFIISQFHLKFVFCSQELSSKNNTIFSKPKPTTSPELKYSPLITSSSVDKSESTISGKISIHRVGLGVGKRKQRMKILKTKQQIKGLVSTSSKVSGENSPANKYKGNYNNIYQLKAIPVPTLLERTGENAGTMEALNVIKTEPPHVPGTRNTERRYQAEPHRDMGNESSIGKMKTNSSSLPSPKWNTAIRNKPKIFRDNNKNSKSGDEEYKRFQASPVLSVGVEVISPKPINSFDNGVKTPLKYVYNPNTHKKPFESYYYNYDYYKPNNLGVNSFNIMNMRNETRVAETEYNAEAMKVMVSDLPVIKSDVIKKEANVINRNAVVQSSHPTNLLSSHQRKGKVGFPRVGENPYMGNFRNKVTSSENHATFKPALVDDYANSVKNKGNSPLLSSSQQGVQGKSTAHHTYDDGNAHIYADGSENIALKTKQTEQGYDKNDYYYPQQIANKENKFQQVVRTEPNPSEIASLVVLQLHAQNSKKLSPEMESANPQSSLTQLIHHNEIPINSHKYAINDAKEHRGANYNHHSAANPHFLEGGTEEYRTIISQPHNPNTHAHSAEEEKEEEEFDEGRITIAKTMLGSKYLKKGTVLVIIAVVIVTFVLGGLAAASVHLSPIILPLALIPIAIVAFLLFIPSIILFVPIVIAGLAGGQEKRRRVGTKMRSKKTWMFF